MLIAIVALGIAFRAHGEVAVIAPDRLREQWLHLAPWDFKQTILYHAGVDHVRHAALINRKARAADIITVLFLGEVVLLAAWLALG